MDSPLFGRRRCHRPLAEDSSPWPESMHNTIITHITNHHTILPSLLTCTLLACFLKREKGREKRRVKEARAGRESAPLLTSLCILNSHAEPTIHHFFKLINFAGIFRVLCASCLLACWLLDKDAKMFRSVIYDASIKILSGFRSRRCRCRVFRTSGVFWGG